MSLPVHSVLSIGIGVLLRLVTDYIFPTNERISGTLLGVFDGALAHIAWRTDTLLEPIVLFETIGGICFDALHHQSLTRLISLVLGILVGIVVSDTARLHLLWEDLGEKVEKVPVTIKDDLKTEVLSSISEDVTVVHDKKKKNIETTSERRRKSTTAAWIEAQRRASTSKTTSRLASTTTNYRHSRLPSLTELETRTHTSVPSTRALKDAEYLATLTPLPPDSIAESIDIGVHPPSSISRFSSPTVKAAPVLPTPSAKPAEPPVEPARPRTPKATVETVSSSSEAREQQPAPSIISHRSARRSPRAPPVEVEATPVIIERVPSVRAPSEHRHSPSHRRSSSRMSAVLPEVIDRETDENGQSYPTPSFAYHFPQLPAPSRSARSVASTRMTSRPAADLANAFLDGMKRHEGSVFSKQGGSRVDKTPARSEAPLPVPILNRSPRSERVPLDSPNSKREIIVNYNADSTQIIIPPPSSTGMNVRAVPSPVPSQGLQLQTHVDASVIGTNSPISQRPVIEETTQASVTSRSGKSPSHHSKAKSMASYPDFETVPPDDEDDGETAKRSQPASGELSSETQPPSPFDLLNAWRDSVPPPSPSLHYSRRELNDDDAIYDPELNILNHDMIVRNSRSHSPHPRRLSDASKPTSQRSIPRSRRSRSITSAREDHAHDDQRTVPRSPGVVEIDRPSAEWFPPGGKQDANHNHFESSYYDPYAELSSRVHDHPNYQTLTHKSFSTISESALSRGPSANLIEEAQKMRDKANDLEAQASTLDRQRREAQRNTKHALAFTLGHESETARQQAEKLRAKADRRLYAAMNTVQDTDVIDLRRLGVLEAVRQTEKSLYELRQKGGTELQVFVASARQDRGPVMKKAIVDKMRAKHHFHIEEDEKDPGLLRIYLPPPTQISV